MLIATVISLACTALAVPSGMPQAQGGPSSRPGPQSSTPSAGPFSPSTLPTTGHKTKFKQYAASTGSQAAASGTAAPVPRPAISPYINLLRPGNLLLNYYSLQRDQQIYNTAAQTQQINTQLQSTTPDPSRQPTQPYQNIDLAPTPLQRRFQPKEDADASLSSAEQLSLLREILSELKALRQDAAAARSQEKP